MELPGGSGKRNGRFHSTHRCFRSVTSPAPAYHRWPLPVKSAWAICDEVTMERTRFQGETTCCHQTVISGAKYVCLCLSLFRSILKRLRGHMFWTHAAVQGIKIGCHRHFWRSGGTGKGAEIFKKGWIEINVRQRSMLLGLTSFNPF